MLAVVVHSAGIQDRDGARLVCLRLRDKFTRLRLIWADGGYSGQLIGWVAAFAGWTLQIVKRCDKAKGFVVLPRRWVEPLLKAVSDEDDKRCKMCKALVVPGLALVADQQATEVAQPGKEALHLPPTLVAT